MPSLMPIRVKIPSYLLCFETFSMRTNMVNVNTKWLLCSAQQCNVPEFRLAESPDFSLRLEPLARTKP